MREKLQNFIQNIINCASWLMRNSVIERALCFLHYLENDCVWTWRLLWKRRIQRKWFYHISEYVLKSHMIFVRHKHGSRKYRFIFYKAHLLERQSFRERKRDRDIGRIFFSIHWSILQIANTDCGWARLKLGAWSSIQISTMSGKNLSTRAFSHCLPSSTN